MATPNRICRARAEAKSERATQRSGGMLQRLKGYKCYKVKSAQPPDFFCNKVTFLTLVTALRRRQHFVHHEKKAPNLEWLRQVVARPGREHSLDLARRRVGADHDHRRLRGRWL